jgi:hypothetical protein
MHANADAGGGWSRGDGGVVKGMAVVRRHPGSCFVRLDLWCSYGGPIIQPWLLRTTILVELENCFGVFELNFKLVESSLEHIFPMMALVELLLELLLVLLIVLR